jgi:hypothetical protein
LIDAGHKASSVPCDVNDDIVEADIATIAGVAPDFFQLLIWKICRCPLTDSDDNRCVFHATFPEGDEDITKVARISLGGSMIKFESGHYVISFLYLTQMTTDNNNHTNDDNNDANQRLTTMMKKNKNKIGG